jgi:hypothetical protein
MPNIWATTNHIFWPLIHPNPNCITCSRIDRDTLPHLLSTCKDQNVKGLRIAIHNKVVHLIAQTLQAKRIHPFLFKLFIYKILINGGFHANTPPRLHIPIMDPPMYTHPPDMPMPSNIEAKYPMHTWSPQQ